MVHLVKQHKEAMGATPLMAPRLYEPLSTWSGLSLLFVSCQSQIIFTLKRRLDFLIWLIGFYKQANDFDGIQGKLPEGNEHWWWCLDWLLCFDVCSLNKAESAPSC